MFKKIQRNMRTKGMTDERNEKMEDQMNGKASQEATIRLDKADVDQVAGGADTQCEDGPIELPEIP